jgi:hypothetical protein
MFIARAGVYQGAMATITPLKNPQGAHAFPPGRLSCVEQQAMQRAGQA